MFPEISHCLVTCKAIPPIFFLTLDKWSRTVPWPCIILLSLLPLTTDSLMWNLLEFKVVAFFLFLVLFLTTLFLTILSPTNSTSTYPFMISDTAWPSSIYSISFLSQLNSCPFPFIALAFHWNLTPFHQKMTVFRQVGDWREWFSKFLSRDKERVLFVSFTYNLQMFVRWESMSTCLF